MELRKLNDTHDLPYTALLYCPPGVGKSTTIGLIAEASEGNTLVLDVDRTITRTLNKGEVVKTTDKIFIQEIDVHDTFKAWGDTIKEITPEFLKQNDIRTVAVDNISELERCILSDLGAKGKNKGVPAMGDYQYMQFMLVNSLRHMKSWGVNIVWTAWEDSREFILPDGTSYTRLVPKVSTKVVDNICGLCDIVGKIFINKDNQHGIQLEASQNVYAKNQVDNRKVCSPEKFIEKKEAK